MPANPIDTVYRMQARLSGTTAAFYFVWGNSSKKGELSMLLKEEKTAIIEKNRLHETDTGSPEVQIAILTERIATLTEHLLYHFIAQGFLLILLMDDVAHDGLDFAR